MALFILALMWIFFFYIVPNENILRCIKALCLFIFLMYLKNPPIVSGYIFFSLIIFVCLTYFEEIENGKLTKLSTLIRYFIFGAFIYNLYLIYLTL